MPEVKWREELREKFYWMIKFQLSRDFEFVLRTMRKNPKIEWAIEEKVVEGKPHKCTLQKKEHLEYALWRDKNFVLERGERIKSSGKFGRGEASLRKRNPKILEEVI